MVRLTNILLENNQIECDYEPEHSQKLGHISVSVDSQEISDYRFSDYEYGKNLYLSAAYNKLLDLLNSKKPIPKEAYAIFY